MSTFCKHQRVRSLTILPFVITAFFLCHPLTMASGEEGITFKLAHCCSTTGPYNIAAEKFRELVMKQSKGMLKAHIFPKHQLGNERELIEGISSGIIQAGVITNAPFGSYQPTTMCLDLPFIFRNYQHAHKVLDGPAGQRLLKSLGEIGIKGLAFAEGGFRNIISKRIQIETPDDLTGIKFRVMETPIYAATFRALGADPVPMAWGNAFKSLKEGIIDGLEIPIAVMFENQFYTVAKYITLTRHTYSPLIIVVSMDWFNNLGPNFQEILKSSAEAAARYERAVVEERETFYMEKLREEGMKIKQIENVEPWKKKVLPVYKQYEKILGKTWIEDVLSH